MMPFEETAQLTSQGGGCNTTDITKKYVLQQQNEPLEKRDSSLLAVQIKLIERDCIIVF